MVRDECLFGSFGALAFSILRTSASTLSHVWRVPLAKAANSAQGAAPSTVLAEFIVLFVVARKMNEKWRESDERGEDGGKELRRKFSMYVNHRCASMVSKQQSKH